MKSLKSEAKDGSRRTVASKEPHHRQAKHVSVNKKIEYEASTYKPGNDVGAIHPCRSASKRSFFKRAQTYEICES